MILPKEGAETLLFASGARCFRYPGSRSAAFPPYLKSTCMWGGDRQGGQSSAHRSRIRSQGEAYLWRWSWRMRCLSWPPSASGSA